MNDPNEIVGNQTSTNTPNAKERLVEVIGLPTKNCLWPGCTKAVAKTICLLWPDPQSETECKDVRLHVDLLCLCADHFTQRCDQSQPCPRELLEFEQARVSLFEAEKLQLIHRDEYDSLADILGTRVTSQQQESDTKENVDPEYLREALLALEKQEEGNDPETVVKLKQTLETELAHPKRWFYLSCWSPFRFVGGVFIHAHGWVHATLRYHEVGIDLEQYASHINLQLIICKIEESDLPSPHFRERLLNDQEVASCGRVATTNILVLHLHEAAHKRAKDAAEQMSNEGHLWKLKRLYLGPALLEDALLQLDKAKRATFSCPATLEFQQDGDARSEEHCYEFVFELDGIDRRSRGFFRAPSVDRRNSRRVA